MRYKSIIAVALVLALGLASTGCADFAEFADRVKSEVLAPFKASLFVFFDEQLQSFAPIMQEWLKAELEAMFNEKTQEILDALCGIR